MRLFTKQSSPLLPAGLFRFSLAQAVIRRPDLWLTALRACRSHTARNWWKSAPFLPLPSASWMRFRLETAYGGDGTGPAIASDLITWLEWQSTSKI